MTVEQIIKDYEIETENLQRFAAAMKYFISKRDLNTITDFISTYEHKYENLSIGSDELDRLIVTTNEGFCVSFTIIKDKALGLINANAFVNVYYNGHESNEIEVASFRNDGARYMDALLCLFRTYK